METKDLKIVIDLKDLYTEDGCYDCGYSGSDGDRDFNAVLKTEIQGQVISRIIKGFTPEVTKQLKDETIDKFSERFEEKISERIHKAIDRGIFTDKDGKTVGVDSFVQNRFEIAISNNVSFMDRIDRNIKESIETMQKQLEKRYDLEFASGIIKNMKEANLLKDGAEKLLLNKE